MPRRALATLLVLAASLGAAPAAHAADIIGISDQSANMFTSPWFRQLDVRVSRLLVSYDAVLRGTEEVARIDAWMAAARAEGVQPLIAFNSARGCYDGVRIPRLAMCRLPGLTRYGRAFDAFRRRYPDVKEFSPWNEINHRSQPTARRPDMAARYYNLVRARCPRCTVVAADVLDAPKMDDYLRAFLRYVHGRPRIWGLHNYRDANNGIATGTRLMLRTVRGQIWLTETGGLVTFGRHRPYDPRRAATATKYMFRLARANRRITRLYIYQWTGSPPTARFDSGLVDPDGTPRPAYYVVRRHLRRPGGNPAPAPTPAPAPPPPAPAPAPPPSCLVPLLCR